MANTFQDIFSNSGLSSPSISNKSLYQTENTSAANMTSGQLQDYTNTLQTKALSSQISKASLGTFELSYSPYNDPNYPITQAVTNANQNINYLGWINLNFAGLQDYYAGQINKKSYTLIDTQITSSEFYITSIDISYFSPDFGCNNYTIAINGTQIPSFTNFRNNIPKQNANGYLFSNASAFQLSVSSLTGLIQPAMVTIVGYGAVATPYSDGINNTASSLEILA